jgi:hypothetical protein
VLTLIICAAYNVTEAGAVYTDDMSDEGLRAAAKQLAEDEKLLDKQFEEGNIALFAGWNTRRRAALGLLGEVCLGIESNQALLRLSGGCELLVGVVDSTGGSNNSLSTACLSNAVSVMYLAIIVIAAAQS